MTADLEAVVVAAYVFADEYPVLARRGPTIHRRLSVFDGLANPKPGETARGRTRATEAGIGCPACLSRRRGPAARLP